MSKLQITAIYDSAAEAYFPPVFMPSKGIAIRSFGDAVLKPDTDFNKHAEYFSLFHLGVFDSSTAQFELFKSPEVIAKAWEIKP